MRMEYIKNVHIKVYKTDSNVVRHTLAYDSCSCNSKIVITIKRYRYTFTPFLKNQSPKENPPMEIYLEHVFFCFGYVVRGTARGELRHFIYLIINLIGGFHRTLTRFYFYVSYQHFHSNRLSSHNHPRVAVRNKSMLQFCFSEKISYKKKPLKGLTCCTLCVSLISEHQRESVIFLSACVKHR